MIFVFKTDVVNITDIIKLRPALDNCLQHAVWNFDLDDCDNILRIDSREDIMAIVIQLLQGKGYSCEELPDQINDSLVLR